MIAPNDERDAARAEPQAGADPSPDLITARTALVPLQAEHDRLTGELRDQAEAAGLGVAAAIKATADLQAALDNSKAPLAAAKRCVATAEAAHAKAVRKHAEAKERARNFAVAELTRKYREGVSKVERTGQQWAHDLRELIATGHLLAAAIDTTEALRLFGEQSILSRLRETMAPVFMIKDGRTDRLLPWPCNPASPFGRDGFETTELKSLAAVARVFDDRDAAEAMRAQLDPGGADWHVLPHPVDGLYHLVHAPLRGKARAAVLGGPADAAPATAEG